MGLSAAVLIKLSRTGNASACFCFDERYVVFIGTACAIHTIDITRSTKVVICDALPARVPCRNELILSNGQTKTASKTKALLRVSARRHFSHREPHNNKTLSRTLSSMSK
ncbi:hypothetical protein FVE85_0344 [Porphyridium purpureum]|uniref:Uncharacterized protein n=1 Tax=Porphyridium purpureum TaxID=35688 RepID=A0A5J4YZP0_PORPP|nr:hypothetical protein FVE85_0344 [Porphyridium purpureum]|eukprot:POR1304..scf208_2